MCDSTKASETGSHDHVVGSCDSDTVDTQLNSDDSIKKELSVRELSYKALLNKEEMEVDVIPMDDIAVYKINRGTEPRVKTNARLLQAKKQAAHSYKILRSLLR